MRGVGPTANTKSRHWSLDDGDPVALATLRCELRLFLADRGASPTLVADVALATQEGAVNALRASSGAPVKVDAWMAAGSVWVKVQDHGPGFAQAPERRCPSVWSTRGRGLCLMDALMDEVQIEHRRGTRVVMCRGLDRRLRPPRDRAGAPRQGAA